MNSLIPSFLGLIPHPGVSANPQFSNKRSYFAVQGLSVHIKNSNSHFPSGGKPPGQYGTDK